MYCSATPFTVGAKPHHVMLPLVAELAVPDDPPEDPPQAAASTSTELTSPTMTTPRSFRRDPMLREIMLPPCPRCLRSTRCGGAPGLLVRPVRVHRISNRKFR